MFTSVYASASIFPNFEFHGIKFHLNGSRKFAYASSPRMDAPLSPIDAHIRHVTVKLSGCVYDNPLSIKVYEFLVVRIVKHMPALRSVKLLLELNKFTRFSESSTSRVGMDALTTAALKPIPANIHTEVELIMNTELSASSVTSRPDHLESWPDGSPTTHSQEAIEWPKSVEKVQSRVDSLDVGAEIREGECYLYYETGGVGQECISNRYIIHLNDRMVPGAFLTLQFPRGFPPHLKKLHLRDPLIVNTTEVLHLLRNCQYLKDLSLFVVFNIETSEHGLPPGLETLELFESGGTILPNVYERLRQLQYAFIEEPSDDDTSRVRRFVENTHITNLELNAVSSSDLKKFSVSFHDWDAPLAQKNLDRYLLQKMKCDRFRHCRISKSASGWLKEYILSLAMTCGAPDFA